MDIVEFYVGKLKREINIAKSYEMGSCQLYFLFVPYDGMIIFMEEY